MKKTLGNFGFSMVGVLLVVALWAIISATVSQDLPSPLKTWQDSKLYITAPWEKRGEMESVQCRCRFKESGGLEQDDCATAGNYLTDQNT